MKKTVGVDKDITIADDINFILETRDAKECLQTPYQVLNATIYFVSREFTDTSVSEYRSEFRNKDLVDRYEKTKKALCLRSKQSVRVATTANVTISGLIEIDGLDLEEGDRVLVKNQTDPSENGIYLAGEDDWVRSADASSSSNIVSGMYVFVEEGIENIATGWQLQSENDVTPGVTPLVFLKFAENGLPESPDENSETILASLKAQIDQSKFTSNFFYKDAVPVKTFGGSTDPDTGELYPAWLNPDMVPVEIKSKVVSDNILIQHDEEGEVAEGKFVLNWNPAGCREGDYFICWSWMPNLAGETLSAHMHFTLEGNGSLTASIPTHVVIKDKYQILMDRYLPEMFKNYISESDISPIVLKGFNDSVAAGFTFVENMANQIIDLLDANATHEQFLPLLSNFFNLRLKSSDPTLWRRQIKKAVPNFKKKGSISGLKEALGDIGMKFLKLTRLWQVVSRYTHQEHFEFSGSNEFSLSKTSIVPIFPDSDFGLWIRRKDDLEWSEINLSTQGNYVQWSSDKITWNGPELNQGDSIRVLYKTRSIPSGERGKEDYIRTLPLMDDRDERSQQYPPKNWNVRLIEEDDPMFDIIIPARHPFADPVIWGKIRTEFPYSENAYNMDEYNGSKRDSLNPCDIDKEFVDSCEQCQSSKFVLDLEADMLSDESFEEAKQIAEEYMPFHALAHTFNLSGGMNEFVGPASEKIETLVTYSGEEYTLAGEAQNIFNRNMDGGQLDNVKRNLLSNFTVVAEQSGVIKNQRVVLFPSAPNSASYLYDGELKGTTQIFDSLNVDTSVVDQDEFENSNLLEVFGSSTQYKTISSIDDSRAVVSGSVQSQLVGPTFEYRVSNKIADLVVSVEQADQIILNDPDTDFSILNIVTQRDLDMGLTTGSAWRLSHNEVEYSVQDILPDGTLLLKYESESDQTSGWSLIDDGVVVKTSQTGSIVVVHYGLVESSDDIQDLQIGDHVCLNWLSSVEYYRIKSFSKTDANKFYIEGYQGGAVGGESVKVYRRVLDRKVGRFGYEGILLVTSENLEDSLSISNGANGLQPVSSSNIKENYLIIIDGEKYYSISDINGLNIVLSGSNEDWGLSGQTTDFSVYKYEKQSLDVPERKFPPVPGHNFASLDRSGGVILSNTEADMGFMASALNFTGGDGSVDFLSQNESIDFKIEYKE